MPPRAPLLPRSDLKALLQAYLERANQTPHDGSLPLSIAGYRCGWLFPPIADTLKNTTGVELDDTQAHIGRSLAPGAGLDALLATIAETLRAAGHTPGWRNELLDVWTDAGDPPVRVAAIERGVMRPLGLVTRAVHLNGWSTDGRLWVARRALTKATDPGMWDTLVGGLIGSGEPEQLALERECDEEAGLDAQDLAPRNALHQVTRMRRRIPEGYQAEDVLTCECVLAPHVIPKNRDGEVMEIRCLAPSEVLRMLQAGAFTVEAMIVITEDLLRNCAGD